MAVYTKISFSQMSEILTKFDIGELTEIIGIQEGVENSNYKIITDKDNFILTIYEKRVKENDLPYFINLMKHLNLNGICCPKPIYDNSGKEIQRISNKNSLLISFLYGKSVKDIQPKHCYEVGKHLAHLHLEAMNFSLNRENNLGYNSWLPLLKSFSKYQNISEFYKLKELEAIISDTVLNWPKGLPKGQIHADLFPNNVFFIDDKLTGIIDFYFACTDILAYDIAVCINSWCFNDRNEFMKERAESILFGYNQIRELTKEERTNLLTLTKGASIRFFLTRLHDWYNTPSDALVIKLDPKEYLDKMLFFNQLNDLELN